MEKLVTVVLPVYNIENYVEKTLKSIVEQEYKNIELIVINDGSKDKTSEICNEFLMSSTIRYKIIDKVNEGVSVARNKGIEIAEGDYIFLLDGDDLIEKETIYKLVEKIEADNLDLVFCGVNKVKDNKIIENYKDEYSYLSNVLTGEETIKKILKREISLSAISVLYKKAIILKENIRFTKGCTNGEDQEFYYKYLCHCNRVSSVNEELSHYIQREDSISNSANLSKFTAIEALERIEKYLKKYFNDDELNKLIENRYKRELFTNLNSIIKFTNDKDYNDIYEIIDRFSYIRKFGNYKALKFSKHEIIFTLRYLFFNSSPKLYVKVFKKIYGR
ncbi:MAG: glycosyltransferase family 2 protein [Sarcina sp.]